MTSAYPSPGVSVNESSVDYRAPFADMPTIGLLRLRKSAKPPEAGTQDAACFDLSAAFERGQPVKVFNAFNEKRDQGLTPDDVFVLYPGHRALIPTGWVFDIPRGYSLRIHPRSGLAWKNGITLANAEAVIDSDYTQETFVMLYNTSDEMFIVKNGDRIAQGELVAKIDVAFKTVDYVDQKTDRIGGLGSTGV